MGSLSPAPWVTDSDCGDESVLDADGFMVADCAIFSMRRDFRPRGGDNVANARLVAAAPYLLDACEDALEAFKLLIASLSHDRAALDMIKPHVGELEIALAKAGSKAA
jgi:hypothetical protein